MAVISLLPAVCLITITGNVVGSGLFYNLTSILVAILFMSGIVIAASGDALQEYLERKEQESASPSLRGKTQTREEEKEFSRRHTGNIPWYKRWFRREVSMIEQNSQDHIDKKSKYHPGHHSGTSSAPESQLEAIKRSNDKNKAKATEEYSNLRGVISGALIGLKKKEIVEEGYRFPTEEGIESAINQIKEAADIAGIEFNVKRWEKSLKDKLPEFYAANLDTVRRDLIDYLESNRERVNEKELKDKVDRLNEILGLSKQDRNSLNGVPLTLEDARRHYIDKARTMSISDFEKIYGVTIISAVPYKTTRGFFNNKDADGLKGKSYIEFLKMSLENRNKRMRSASGIKKNSNADAFFSPIGIVMDEGRIYDASREDIVSQANEGIRIAGQNVGHARDEALEKRIDETVNHVAGGLMTWNEFLVGKYSPRGVYFIRDKLKDLEDRRSEVASENITYKETIRSLAQFSIDNKLRLYEFVEGQGFTELNPQDYLLSEANKQRQKFVDESGKTARIARRTRMDV